MTAEPRFFRKIIRIAASDSPNVKLGLIEAEQGREPSHRVLVPGVLTYAEYLKRRATWNKIRQCVGLDARFYDGAEVKMFPREWLDRAQSLWDVHRFKTRQAKGVGCDPGEGAANSSCAAADEWGVVEIESHKTPDTTDVNRIVTTFAARHRVPWDRVCFDRGGGGKQHADQLRERGYKVRTVAFGGRPELEPRRWRWEFRHRTDAKEDSYAYVSRRAEMYDTFRQLLDPGLNPGGYSIPKTDLGDELCRQLAPIPLSYDGEGRLYVMPKNKKDKDSDQPCLTDLIGHSPDETDAVLLAVYAMKHDPVTSTAGVDA